MRDRDLLEQKNKNNRDKEIYTDKEAADYLRISQVTLWRERKAGRISFRRVASKIIYLTEDLEAYLERNKRDAFGKK
jgi:predicted site-specific integrase-resolvase